MRTELLILNSGAQELALKDPGRDQAPCFTQEDPTEPRVQKPQKETKENQVSDETRNHCDKP